MQGTKGGKPVIYRLGTLTCKGALPTGVAPARAAIWLAEGWVPPGVHPPEAVLDPEPFFKELEQREIYTQVSVTTDPSGFPKPVMLRGLTISRRTVRFWG